MLRTIIFFGCFLAVAGSAWAQFVEDRRQPARQLQANLQLVQGFDAWFQQQRDRQQQQHTRYRQEARQHEWNQRHRLREYDRLRQGPLQPY